MFTPQEREFIGKVIDLAFAQGLVRGDLQATIYHVQIAQSILAKLAGENKEGSGQQREDGLVPSPSRGSF